MPKIPAIGTTNPANLTYVKNNPLKTTPDPPPADVGIAEK
jgi:hypothetical protein